MKRYCIDTCVFIWIMGKKKRVDNIVYDMQYYQGEFFISMEAVTELFYLIQSGKVKIFASYDVIFDALKTLNIKILEFDLKALKILQNLPFFKEHNDPTDRNIIAHAIANNCALISSDENFPLYEPFGLKYIEV